MKPCIMPSQETAIEKKPFVRILVHSQTPPGPGVSGDQSPERIGVSNEPPIASASESAQSQQSSQSALINSELTSNNHSFESFETADEEHENDASNHELTPSTSQEYDRITYEDRSDIIDMDIELNISPLPIEQNTNQRHLRDRRQM